eukprot:787714-Pleurochrysis_carterae.AAC.1
MRRRVRGKDAVQRSRSIPSKRSQGPNLTKDVFLARSAGRGCIKPHTHGRPWAYQKACRDHQSAMRGSRGT